MIEFRPATFRNFLGRVRSARGLAHNLEAIVLYSAAYVTLAFAYSFIAFFSPQPPLHFHEYSLSRLAVELAGHFAFGAIAAIPLLGLDLILLSGIFAVLIDSDHLLATLQFPVNPRPDHSILFVLLATTLFAVASRTSGRASKKVATIVVTSFLSHLAYDIFAGAGSNFPLYIPFNFGFVDMSFGSWLPIEITAFLVSMGSLFSQRYRAHN